MRCVEQSRYLNSAREVLHNRVRGLGKVAVPAKLKGRSQFVPVSWHEGGIYIVLGETYLGDEQFWGRAVRASLIRKGQGRFLFPGQTKPERHFLPKDQALGDSLHSRGEAIS